jgi:DNA-binding MarR family transcriptional regulator
MARWLDDDEMRAWRGLVAVHLDVLAALEAELLEQHGLHEGDYAVLVSLSEADGQSLRMCDLAKQLHLSASGLTRRLDGLVQRGYVERTPSPDDRRVTLALLTSRGVAKLEEAAPDHVDGVRRHLLDHLSRRQIRELAAALAAVERGRADERLTSVE